MFEVFALSLPNTDRAPEPPRWAVYTEASSTTYSESFDVAALLDGLETNDYAAGGERAYTHNLAAVGIARGRFDLAVIGRYDYVADYSEDGADFLNATINDVATSPRIYDISVGLNHAASIGLRAGYTHPITDRLSLRLRVSALYAREMFDGALTGRAQIATDETITAAAQADYRFSNDILLGRSVPAPTGFGYALDLAAQWRASERLELTAEVTDLIASIHWTDVARTVADADSDILDRDEDGLITVRPLIQGRFETGSHTQQFDPRTRLSARYAVSERWSLDQRVDLAADIALFETRLARRIANAIDVGPVVELHTGALGAFAEGSHFRLWLVTDQLDLGKARYLSVGAAATLRF